ncbi:MAG: IclR family transcriptional regulator [Acidimicrobiales bacterium]
MGDNGRISAQGGSRSVDRSMAVLLLLAKRGHLGIGEMARILTIPKSSTANVLRALVARNFVAQDRDGRYCLGLGTFEIGAAYLRAMTPTTSVQPELESLSGELSATSHFAVLDGDEVVYLATHDSALRALDLASSVGARLPAATTAVGKAQLAFLPARDDERQLESSRFVEFTRIRILGYAVDDGGTVPGVACVAAPIFSPNGCCGAIGVSTLISSQSKREVIVEAIGAAAARATLRLGGVRPHVDALELGHALQPDSETRLSGQTRT